MWIYEQTRKGLASASKMRQGFDRFLRFLHKPAKEQRRCLLLRWLRHVPGIPVLVRVPQIGWWLARNDACGHAMLSNAFENRERRFVDSVLKTGMTVLDIGAHHGLYTLLASRKVGPRGLVVAFEPSTRERKCLLKHLRLNRCKNVEVEAVALGCESGLGELFVVEGLETGCNCLRPPNVSEPTIRVSVPVDTLDDYLARRGINRADFIKIDVEGAELEVFKGATGLLIRQPRPVILAEVEDVRTAVWGHPAKAFVDFLRQYGYRWFRFSETGLQPVGEHCSQFNESLIAVPRERELDLAFHHNTFFSRQPC